MEERVFGRLIGLEPAIEEEQPGFLGLVGQD